MAPPQTTSGGAVPVRRFYRSNGHRSSLVWSQPPTSGEDFPVRRVYKRHFSMAPSEATRGRGRGRGRVYGGHRSSLVWRRGCTATGQSASGAVKELKGAKAGTGKMIATHQSRARAVPATVTAAPYARPSPISHCSAPTSHFASNPTTGLNLDHFSGGTSPFRDGASTSSFHPTFSSRAPKTHVLNNLQSVEVYFHSGNQITAYTVSVRSIFTAQAVLQELQSLRIPTSGSNDMGITTITIIGFEPAGLHTDQLPLSGSSRKLRLLELCHGEKFKVFSSDDIVQFQLYNKKEVTLHAERVPEFEEKLEDNERILQIFRIIRDNDSGLVKKSEEHLVIYSEGDTIAMVKEQLQEDFEVPDSFAEKWKFHYMSHSRGTSFPLQDAHIVSDYFQRTVSGVWAEYLLWEDLCSLSENVEDMDLD